MKTIKLIISVDIETNNENLNDVLYAAKKGLIMGFDIKGVAPPDKVKINYLQER